MKSGDDVFAEMEGEKYFPLTKERQCSANPNLAGFMSKWILTTETEEKIQRRLLQMALLLFEIIGAGDISDDDYVKVSKESIKVAERSKEPLEIENIYEADLAFGRAIFEAKRYITAINNYFNESGETQIEAEIVWQKLEIFLKSYWIEKKKQKG